MQTRKWSETDTLQLTAIYHTLDNKKLARYFERTPDSIAQKATRLGLLKKPKAAKVEPEPEQIEQTATGEYLNTWPPSKISLLQRFINLFKNSK